MAQTIGGIIKESINQGKPNDEILRDVYAVFPSANTKAASVNWYRSQMKKDGVVAPRPAAKRAIPAKKTVAEKVALAYEVRAVRTQRGPNDHVGYSCNLYRDGKQVARVTDWAADRPVEFVWTSLDEEQAFSEYCLTLPKWTSDEKEPKTFDRHTTPELAVEELVNHTIVVKMVRQLCKKVSYVTTDGKLYTLSNQIKVTPGTIAQHVPAGASCLNTLSEAEAVKLIQSLR